MNPVKEGTMTESTIVILGSMAIFGLVMTVTIALVYNRNLGVRASSESIEVSTGDTRAVERGIDATRIANENSNGPEQR